MKNIRDIWTDVCVLSAALTSDISNSSCDVLRNISFISVILMNKTLEPVIMSIMTLIGIYKFEDVRNWWSYCTQISGHIVKCWILQEKNKQLFTSQDVNWWIGVVWIACGLLWCFYQLFGLSFWRHPFTAEDPLVSKWCNTFLQIWWRNKLIYILYGLRVTTFSSHFHFWGNYSFKIC